MDIMVDELIDKYNYGQLSKEELKLSKFNKRIR